MPSFAGRTPRFWAWAAVLASAAALAAAYAMEWGMGLPPCEMCYWQRIPYAAVILLGLAAALLRRPRWRMGLLWLCLAALALETALAMFHAGVEWRWWEGPTTCSGGIDASMTLEQILNQIKAAATVSCTDAALRVLGLSIAGWNAVYALACTVLLAIGLSTRKKEN